MGSVPSLTEISEVQGDIGKMWPAGKNKKFSRGSGRDVTPGGVCVVLTSKAMVPEGANVPVTPLVRDAEVDLPEVVSSRIAERVPSSDIDDEVLIYSDVAGKAPLAVAEVASSADFAGVATPADLAGAFPADLAGMAFPAVAGVASSADLAGMAVLAVAGVTSPAVLAEMAVCC